MHQRGFTFVEVLIVVGLVGLILGFGMVMSYSSIARVNVIQERDLLVSLLLSGARARAMANIGEVSHGVHIDNTTIPHKTYTLFEGDDYADDPASYRVVNFSSDTNLVTNAANDDEFDIVFERRSGNMTTPVSADTITLSGGGKDITFDINEYGRIDW